MDIVDAHAHIWDVERFDYAWLRGLPALNRRILWADLESHLESNQVVLVEAHNSRAETDWLLEIAQAQPQVLAVVGAALEPAELKAWLPDQPEKLSGLRLNLAVPDVDWRRVADTLEVLADRDLSCDFLLPLELPSRLLEVLCGVPLRVVLNHFAGAIQPEPDVLEWRRALEPLAEMPQVYVKLSGRKVFCAPLLETAFSLFGAERLLYGSDFPLNNTILEPWLGGLSVLEQQKILGGNARRVYSRGRN